MIDLRDLGVTPAHQDRQEVLDTLAARVDAARAEVVARPCDEARASYALAVRAHRLGRQQIEQAVLDEWAGAPA